MCTAACYKTKDFYFGRTLDYEFSYGDRVVITPRNFPFSLRHGGVLEKHFAMIGMACVIDGYPLYYDAVNEAGLCCAGLNFVGNAVYEKPAQGRRNLAQFELIPFLLGSCKSVAEAKGMLREICRSVSSCPSRSCTGSLPMQSNASLWNARRTACTFTKIPSAF